MRLALVGDIGGHYEELYAALVTLGMHPETLELPADLCVIQVGDLVHRGPQSDETVQLVDALIRTRQWKQLMGNHEALRLGLTDFIWDQELSEETDQTLETWWSEGLLQLGVAIRTKEYGDILVTHAGLTAGAWREMGSPTTAIEAAEKINVLGRAGKSAVWREGVMTQGRTNFRAGTVWAEAGKEVLASWINSTSIPFALAHGHTSLYRWEKQGFTIDPKMLEKVDVDANDMHVVAYIHGKPVIGVDPGFGRKAHAWAPLMLEGEVL